MIGSLYFPLIVLAAIVGLCTAGFALLYRDRPGATPLAVYAASASLWATVEALEVTQSGIETMQLWTSVALSLSAVLPAVWLVFALEYTGEDRRVPAWLYPGLLVEPVAFWVLVWTNRDHNLVWTGVERITYAISLFSTWSTASGSGAIWSTRISCSPRGRRWFSGWFSRPTNCIGGRGRRCWLPWYSH